MAKYDPQKASNNLYPAPNLYSPKFRGVQLYQEKFNAVLNEYGVRIRHEKVALCPNLVGNVDSNYHELNCTLCENSFVHFDPQELWGLYQQNALVESFFSQGMWDKGVAVITLPSHKEGDPSYQYYFDYFDRITILDFEERFYEIINKSDGDKDNLRYEALSVQFLRTVSTIFEFRKDFDLDTDGNIIWITNNRPKYDLERGIGEAFTISYLRRPVYRIVEMLHEGRYSQKFFKEPERIPVRMPQQAIMKKDFLIDKDGADQQGRVSQVSGGSVVAP